MINNESPVSGQEPAPPTLIGVGKEHRPSGVEAEEVSQIAREAIADNGKGVSKGHIRDAGHLRLNRAKLQRDLKNIQQAEIKSLHPFFHFIQNLTFKLKLIFGMIGEKLPEEGINSRILSQIVRAGPGQAQCSSSILLSYTHKYVKQQNDIKQAKGERSEDDQKLEENLKKAADCSEQIEKLQQKANLRANSKEIRSLVKKLKREVDQLEDGEKKLIPGGWQQEGGQFADALFEIEKTGGTFNVKVLSLSGENKDYWKGEKNLETEKIKYLPFLEFREVSTQQLQDSLEPLILIQLPQIYQFKGAQDRGFLGERVQAIHRLIAHDDSSSNPQVYLTPLRVMHALYQKTPQPSAQNFLVSVPQEPSFSKTLLTYLKSINPEHYKSAKLELELSAFFNFINQDTQAFLQNQSLRDLAQVSARKMIFELEKNKDEIGLDAEFYDNTLRDLKDILELAQKLDQKTGLWGLPDLTLAPHEQTFKLLSPISPNSLGTLQTEKKKTQEVSFIDLQIPAVDADKNVAPEAAQASLDRLQVQIKVIKELYKKEDYAAMETAILDLARQLPPPTALAQKTDFWKAIYNGDNSNNYQAALAQTKEWNAAIFELSQLLFDSQQAQAPSISPEKVVANANFLAIADRLMTLQSTHTQDPNLFLLPKLRSQAFRPMVYFDPKEIKDVLRNDPYFRLTSANQHGLAQELLKYWDDAEANQRQFTPRAAIKLDNWKHFMQYSRLLFKCGSHDKIPPQKNPALQAYITNQGANEYLYLMTRLKAKFPDQTINWASFKKVFKEIEVSPDGSNILPPEVIQQRKMHLMMKGSLAHQHAFTIDSSMEFLEAGSRMVKEAGGNVNTLSLQEMWQRLWKIQDEKAQGKFRTNRPGIDAKTKDRAHIQWHINDSGKIFLHPSGVRFDLKAYADWKKWHNDQEFYKENGKHLDGYTDAAIVQFELGVKNEGQRILTQQTIMNQARSKEEKILRSIQTGASRLEQTFAAFSEHPELLNSTSKQRLFELNIFKQGELLQKINEQPAFARELLNFAKNNLELARGTRDIQRALFFIELQNNFKEYTELSDLPENEKQQILNEFPPLNDYEQILNICVNDQEKRAVYGGRLVHYLHQIEQGTLKLEQLTENERYQILNEILKGYFLHKSLSTGKAGQNPETNRQIQSLMIRVKPYIKEMLSDKDRSHALFQDLSQLLKVPLGADPIRGQFPRFSVGKQTVDLEKGLIFSGNKANGLLPNEILEHEMIQRLFKDKKTGGLTLSGEAQLEFKIDPKTGTEVIVYTFKQQPNLRLIKGIGQDLIIQMKMHGSPQAGWTREKWFELTPFQDPRKTGGENHEHQLPGEMSDLVLGRFVWRELQHPSHFIVKDESNESYLYDIQLKQIEDRWQLKKVKRFKDDLVLVNPWNARKQLGSLTAIEDPAHIKVWATASQKISEFEFPRIKMPDGTALAYRTRRGLQKGQAITVLESVQANDFIMPFQPPPLTSRAPKHNLGIELLPHMFKDFQLLVNSKTGAKKVLIPLQELTRGEVSAAQAKYANWSDQTKLDHRAQSWNTQSLLEFEIDSVKTALKTDNKQANLFLSYLFFANKSYEQALEYLNASETSLALSPSHRNLYDWIEKWPDATPEGIAFKLKAALALKAHQYKQETSAGSQEQELLATGRLSDLFKAYEKNASQLPDALKLTDKELDLHHRIVHQTYLPALSPIPLKKPTLPIPATAWELSAEGDHDRITPQLLARVLFIEMRGSTLPQDEFPLTSEKPFIQGFRVLYESILKANPGSEEYRRLTSLVELAQLNSPVARSAQRLLKGVVHLKERISEMDADQQQKTLALLAFPDKFSQPYFKFSRLTALSSSDANFQKLEDFLDNLDKTLGNAKESPDSKAGPQIDKKDKLADLPKQEHEFDPNGLEIKPDFREKTHLFQAKHALKKQGVELAGLSPEKALNELRKVRKLDQLAQDRRVAELGHRRAQLDNYLQANPVEPVKSVKELEKVVLGQPENVLHYERPMEDFFEVRTVARDAKELAEQVEKTTRFFNTYTAKDAEAPSVQRLTEKYQTDTKAFIEQQKVEEIKFRRNGNVAELKKTVEDKLKEVSKSRAKAEAQILSLLKPQRRLPVAQEVLSHHFKAVPQRLIGLYVDRRMEDVNTLMGLNLTKPQIQALDGLVKDWMAAAIQERMVVKALDQLRDIPSPSKASPEVVQELYQALAPKRFFSLDDHSPDSHCRELLSIEFATGFILRANQIETIHAMLKDPNQVKQLGMGQGKSSVILPMLLHRLADGQRLAIGVLPEWLYEIVSGDLDKSSRALFGQDIFKFEFDRNTTMDREWLLNQYTMLAGAIKEHNAVVTTKTFLLSFRNKFLEMQADLEHATDYEQAVLNEKLGLMANILTLFKERGAAIADEVDTILDIRQELNYAIGLPVKMDPKKWQMGLQLYRKILASPALKAYADKLRKNEQGLFTADDIANVQMKVGAEFYEHWKTNLLVDGQAVPMGLFCRYLQGKTDLGVPLKDRMPPFMQALKDKNSELYQDIGLLRQYLTQTLPTTLSHSGNVHYGRASDGENTIPYKANNTPSAAEFGEEFERIGHFVQDYVQNGLSEIQIQAWVNALLTQISSEMYEHMTETGSMGSFEETPSYRKFHKEFPSIDLTQASQDPAILANFLNQLNQNDETKLNFLQTWIFPSLEMANRQVSSNAHDLVNLVGSFSGFTGTPWNVDTYHTKINAQNAQAVGTDGKTVELLTRMFEAGDLSIRTVNLDAEQPLASILAAVPEFMDRYDSLIDAGYYLKGVDSQDVAAKLSQNKKTNKRALVYVTTENAKVIQTLGKDDAQPLQNRKDIQMQERITYYDQAHTIGTDIPHAQTARAALTVGEKMYAKDFFQALWRMRKIDKGQKVDLILSEDVKKLVKAARSPAHPNRESDVITVQDVILFCIKNQAEREAEDNLRAERQKMMGLVPNAMFWQLVEASRGGETPARLLIESKEGFNAKKTLFKTYKQFLLKALSSDYDALAAVASPEASHKVLNDLRDQLILTFENVKDSLNLKVANAHFKGELGEAIEQLKNHRLLDANKLPEETEGLFSDAKDSHVQTQRQQQQQISVEAQGGIIPPDPMEVWNTWNVDHLQELWDVSKNMGQAKSGVPFLDDEVRFTPNFSPENASTQGLSLTDRLLGPKCIPVAQILVMQDTRSGEWRTVLLDIKDYEDVVAKLMKLSPEQPFKAAIFDVRPQKGTLLLRSTAALHGNPWDEQEMQTITEKLVKIKVFNRQVNFFDRREVNALKKWVSADPKGLKEYFETKILTPSLQSAYLTSTLAKTFSHSISE